MCGHNVHVVISSSSLLPSPPPSLPPSHPPSLPPSLLPPADDQVCGVLPDLPFLLCGWFKPLPLLLPLSLPLLLLLLLLLTFHLPKLCHLPDMLQGGQGRCVCNVMCLLTDHSLPHPSPSSSLLPSSPLTLFLPPPFLTPHPLPPSSLPHPSPSSSLLPLIPRPPHPSPPSILFTSLLPLPTPLPPLPLPSPPSSFSSLFPSLPPSLLSVPSAPSVPSGSTRAVSVVMVPTPSLGPGGVSVVPDAPVVGPPHPARYAQGVWL